MATTKHGGTAGLWFGLILVMILCRPALALNQGDARALARALLQQSQRHCAMIAVPHCGDGELAIGFWTHGGDSRLLVDAFENDPARLATAQAKAAALGLLGRNIYVRAARSLPTLIPCPMPIISAIWWP